MKTFKTPVKKPHVQRFLTLDQQLRNVKNFSNLQLIITYPRQVNQLRSAKKVLQLNKEFFYDERNILLPHKVIISRLLDIKHDEHAKYLTLK